MEKKKINYSAKEQTEIIKKGKQILYLIIYTVK